MRSCAWASLNFMKRLYFMKRFPTSYWDARTKLLLCQGQRASFPGILTSPWRFVILARVKDVPVIQKFKEILPRCSVPKFVACLRWRVRVCGSDKNPFCSLSCLFVTRKFPIIVIRYIQGDCHFVTVKTPITVQNDIHRTSLISSLRSKKSSKYARWPGLCTRRKKRTYSVIGKFWAFFAAFCQKSWMSTKKI